MKSSPAYDFYEIQQKQQRKSYILIGILFLFYFCAVGFLSVVLLFSVGLLFLDPSSLFSSTLPKFLLANTVLSGIIAFFHFFEARKFGAKFILKRIQAKPPDSSDRYHKRFMNTLEEMRIASGLPKVTPFIIPGSAINSMALIQANREPCVIITEGLIAELTRDEVQAVIAHELAHIIRGDSFYLTLVCSLASLFERIRQSLEPEGAPEGSTFGTYQGQGQAALAYSALTLSSLIMNILSTLINREREILADAAAVELSRNPRALARAIYKAHMRNSFVGDFNLTYSPLFIVSPESKGISEGFFTRLFNSHPPLMKRIGLLADMIHTNKESLIEEVWNIQKERKKARQVHPSFEEHHPDSVSSLLEKQALPQGGGKIWLVRNPKGSWDGPFSLEEALFLRYFTPLIRMKNLQEEIEASANEFPQIREALRRSHRRKPLDPSRYNHCPRCKVLLKDSYYEGTAIKSCAACKGRLVESSLMDRIIARKEITFSKALVEKAHEFKWRFMSDPVYTKKIKSGKFPSFFCPNCGGKMLARPYNYHLVIPVDKCLMCNQIWFDSDELEILQILVENP